MSEQNQERRGVNFELSNDLSRVFYEAAKQTWANRLGRFGEVDERHETFAGFRGIKLGNLPSTDGLIIESGPDGVGTKVEIAERTRNHRTVAFDLLAMGCDDRSRWGAEPIFATIIFDARTLDDNLRTRQAVTELAEGLIEASHEADIVIIGGETAELGSRVGGYAVNDTDLNYNLAISVVGLVHESRLITGQTIEKGDALVGLADPGFRSNGISKVRQILHEQFGEEWHDEPFDQQFTYGQAVQTPSTIYSRFINHLTGGFDIRNPATAEIRGIAHITGGGLPEKLARLLEPTGCGAVIDNPMTPPAVMTSVQELGQVPDQEAYKNWHMGCGMVIATPEPDRVVELAQQSGVIAQRIGTVIKSRFLSIRSRGVEHPDRPVNYFV